VIKGMLSKLAKKNVWKSLTLMSLLELALQVAELAILYTQLHTVW